MTYDPMQTGEVLDAIDALRCGVVACAKAELEHGTAAVKGSRRVLHYWESVGCKSGGKMCTAFQLHQLAGLTQSRGAEWCGVFALYVLHEAGLTDQPWVLGSGFVSRILRKLGRDEASQPGDVFVGPAPMWHHGIVERHYDVNGRPWLASIEGNTPCVKRRDRPAPATPITRDDRIVGWSEQFTYFSILPLIKHKLGILQ